MIKKYGHLILIGVIIVLLFIWKGQCNYSKRVNLQFNEKIERIEKKYSKVIEKHRSEIEKIKKEKAVIADNLTDKEKKFNELLGKLNNEMGYTYNLNQKIKKAEKENRYLQYKFEELKKCNEAFNLCVQSRQDLQMRFDVYKKNDELENARYESIITATESLSLRFQEEARKYYIKMKRIRKQRNLSMLINAGLGAVVLLLFYL